MWFLGQAEGINLGTLLQAACGSWDRLRALVNEVTDNRGGGGNLTLHFSPASSENHHSHHVKKIGETWNVSFQHRRFDQFPWLSLSAVLSGDICRYCILFLEQLVRGSNLEVGNRSGV